MSQGEPGIELDTSLGYLLKAAASALHCALEAVLRPLGMTITHYACLELLAQRPGLSNSGLARGAFVTRQSMNVLLQALERQGLVVRPAQAPVGRALPTELTARGRRQLKVASAAVRRVEQDMLANLDVSEQDQMRRLLTACIAALTQPPASATSLLRNLRLCRVPGGRAESRIAFNVAQRRPRSVRLWPASRSMFWNIPASDDHLVGVGVDPGPEPGLLGLGGERHLMLDQPGPYDARSPGSCRPLAPRRGAAAR